ncbi:MAG: hypothetical protein ACXW2E_01665 [Nitrososphaeraceae archaeon]
MEHNIEKLAREQRYAEGCVNSVELEYEIINKILRLVCDYMIERKAGVPNLVNFIALNQGSFPLLKDEKLTTHYGESEYEITRTK